MRCPFTKEEIKDCAVYTRAQSKKRNLSTKELRFLILCENFPILKDATILKDLYLNKLYSLPDFKREFGLNYEQTQFILKYYNIPKRTMSESCKACRPKAEKTFKDKHGVSNPSQLQAVKDKKAATFIKHYGVDNIWKTKEFKDGLDDFYLEKYGVDYRDFQKVRSKKVWDNKTKEQKQEWLEKSILTDEAQDNARKHDGYIISNGEREIGFVLDNMMIEYVRQFRLYFDKKKKRRFYDFYIPVLNLIIEYNGDFWHANPNKYKENDILNLPSGKIEAKKIWEKDAFKLDLAKRMGHNIITIWESETKHKSKQEIKALIEYKIINYELSSNDSKDFESSSA